MASELDEELNELFARIQSPQTAKRFKLLSSVPMKELAECFKPDNYKLHEQADFPCFEPDPMSPSD